MKTKYIKICWLSVLWNVFIWINININFPWNISCIFIIHSYSSISMWDALVHVPNVIVNEKFGIPEKLQMTIFLDISHVLFIFSTKNSELQIRCVYTYLHIFFPGNMHKKWNTKKTIRNVISTLSLIMWCVFSRGLYRKNWLKCECLLVNRRKLSGHLVIYHSKS